VFPNKKFLQPHAPCATCPWRKDALPGFFGPYSAEYYWRAAHSESWVQCHSTSSLPEQHHRHCTGVALHRQITIKRMRDPELNAHQEACVRRYGTDGILGFDFCAHHNMERK
jgi:hypothetical protein